MARKDRLRQHLPTLYRPDPGADSLLAHLLDALGFGMDEAQQQMSQIMQAHWFSYADKASFDEHALRDRERRGLPPYNVRDPGDQLEVARYPYIEDLARHGKLVAVAPWREPPNQRDLVENYRRRITRYMQAFRQGLGTRDAIRTMVEAELPWALDRPLPERIRSFAIEEGLHPDATVFPVTVNGVPTDKVGALMRWQLTRGEALPTRPILLLHGVASVAGEVEETSSPIIERYDPLGEDLIGIGVAYAATLADGETLRLQPTRRSWIAGGDGLRQSPLVDEANSGADPSANGPWTAAPGSPGIEFDCLYASACGALWMAGAQQLWRYDGDQFTRILEGEAFTAIHCLFEFHRRLLIGCDDGLFLTPLYPGDGVFSRSAIAELAGVAVHQVISHQSELWLATDNGPCRLTLHPDDSVTLDAPLIATATYSLLFLQQERYFGCELGLLRHDLASGQWHAYRGETTAEPQLNWLATNPASLPAAADLGLPPVRCLAITPDQSLWLGSDEGLARYYARHETDLLYRAVLEACGDLVPGTVRQLRCDDRGMLWIACDRGLLRCDGRDMAQYRFEENRWQQLGRVDSVYPDELAPRPRGQWRYNRVDGRWEEFDARAQRWSDHALDVRTAAASAINQVLLTDSLMAHLGSWDGTTFSIASAVAPELIRMRCKPDPQTIVAGGPPFIPGLPSGTSTWRYLQLEPDQVTPPEDLPWWSREGRLFPPPAPADIYPGRYRNEAPGQDGRFDESVFAYLPSAMVTMIYPNPLALAVNVRLFRRDPDDAIDPAVVDRVFQGINFVRPAGVPVTVTVEGKLMRGTTP